MIYLYLNSYTAQVLLNSLFSGAGAADIVCAEGTTVWCNAGLSWGRAPLCGNRACQTPKRVVKCECVLVRLCGDPARVGGTNGW